MSTTTTATKHAAGSGGGSNHQTIRAILALCLAAIGATLLKSVDLAGDLSSHGRVDHTVFFEPLQARKSNATTTTITQEKAVSANQTNNNKNSETKTTTPKSKAKSDGATERGVASKAKTGPSKANTSQSKGSSTATTPKGKFLRDPDQFWRYDEAGPEIVHARTHFLSSLPQAHRIGPLDHGKDKDSRNYTSAIEAYSQNSSNVFPQKLHLSAFNPSIARLPKSYYRQERSDWWKAFGGPHTPRAPVYVASYRVSELHGCFAGDHQLSIKYGGNWTTWWDQQPLTDLVGLALLDKDLNVVADTILTVEDGKHYFDIHTGWEYQDYRVFTLAGGNETNGTEQLYLTTETYLVPLELTAPEAWKPDANATTLSRLSERDQWIKMRDVNRSHRWPKRRRPPIFRTNDQQVELPRAFPAHSSSHLSFGVWARKQLPCMRWYYEKGAGYAKNLLYFDEEAASADGGHVAVSVKGLFFPNQNPNFVYPVDPNQVCQEKRNQKLGYDVPYPRHQPHPFPPPSFRTMDEELYPKDWLSKNHKKIFMGDRWSACCVRVPFDSVPVDAPSLAQAEAYRTNRSSIPGPQGDTLLVAVTHPKTMHMDRKLPAGVATNIYFSRFVAFLPHEPYTIVARSGQFCLPFPEASEMTGDRPAEEDHPGFLEYHSQGGLLRFGNETVARCPKIHFVTGLLDEDPENNDSSVILSYGVNDCLSRFVKVRKSDVIDMFHGPNVLAAATNATGSSPGAPATTATKVRGSSEIATNASAA